MPCKGHFGLAELEKGGLMGGSKELAKAKARLMTNASVALMLVLVCASFVDTEPQSAVFQLLVIACLMVKGLIIYALLLHLKVLIPWEESDRARYVIMRRVDTRQTIRRILNLDTQDPRLPVAVTTLVDCLETGFIGFSDFECALELECRHYSDRLTKLIAVDIRRRLAEGSWVLEASFGNRRKLIDDFGS